MQASFLRKLPPLYIFIALLAIVSCIYNYPVILFHRPYSIHLWRQCDCLSMALIYYESGMHFFSPAVHWCGLNGNGNAAPGECTWIYYTVAILWKVFGYHEFIYRLFDMAILYAGLIALYKTAAGILNSHYWGMIVSLFLFSSAIVAYYGNNFIPDPTALSLALIAWYFFYKFSVTKKNVSFIISMLFFGIAGATKVTALISFVPIVLAFFAEKFNIISFKKDDKLFKGTLLPIALFALAIAPIGSWIAFSIHYNNQNNIGLFGSHILPIWELNAAQIKPIKANLYFGEMSDLFLDRLGLKIFLLLFIYILINYKRASRFLLFLTVFITLGAIAYILLWFQVFDVHDYYLINVLVWVPATLLTFLHLLQHKYPLTFQSNGCKIFFALLLAYCMYYAGYRTRIRYNTNDLYVKYSFLHNRFEFADLIKWQTDYDAHFKALETISPYLRSIGIKSTDLVMSLPDVSNNNSLYIMDQKGFTGFSYTLTDTNTIRQIIKTGAKYLILNDTTFLPQTVIAPFINKQIGRYRNVNIYSLKEI